MSIDLKNLPALPALRLRRVASRPSILATTAAALVLLGSCDVQHQLTASDNIPPAVQDFSLTIPKAQPYTFVLPAADANGDSLVYELASEPNSGTILLARDGSNHISTYTPDSDFAGIDEFAYRVSDGESAVEGTVTLEVIDRSPRLVAAPAVIRRPAEGAASVPFEIRAWDPDGDSVFVDVVEASTSDKIVAGVPRLLKGDTFAIELTYSAPANAGEDTFQLVATDGRSASRAVAVEVVLNGRPAVAPDTLSVPKTSPVVVVLAASDPDGDPLTFSIVAAPEHGTLSPISAVDTAAAHVTYRPGPGFSGTDAFEVVASDGFDLSDPTTVSIRVLNAAPLAVPHDVQAQKNGPTTITLAGTDPDGDELIFSIASVPEAGELSDLTDLGDGTATVVYLPRQGFDGADSFQYVVSDGTATSGEADVRIEVENLKPRITTPDTATVAAGDTVRVPLSGSDADGDALKFSVSGQPAAGAVLSITSTGLATATLAYLASSDPGVVSLSVRVGDGTDLSQSAEVVIRVQGAPTAGAMESAALEDGHIEIELSGDDPEDGPVIFSIVSTPANGTLGTLVTGEGTARATYTPSPDFNGADAVTYRVTDSFGLSADGVVAITVASVNDAPSFTTGANVEVADDSGPYDEPWATSISAGPADEAGQVLAFEIASTTNTSLFASGPSITADGRLSFTPAPGMVGSSVVTLVLKDDGGTANGGDDTSDEAELVIDVYRSNAAFVDDGDVSVLEDSPAHTASAWASSAQPGPAGSFDTDARYEVVSVSEPSLFAALPEVTFPDGDLTFTPAPNAFGTADVAVKLHDGHGGVSPASTFTITITPVNDAPSFSTGATVEVADDSGPYDEPWAASISAGPADEAGQALTFEIVSSTNTSLFASGPSLTADGRLSLTPVPGMVGSSVITLVLKDDGGTANGGDDTSDEAELVINVYRSNADFVDDGDVSVLEDSPAHTASAWASSAQPGPTGSFDTDARYEVVSVSEPSLFAALPAVTFPDGDLTFTPAPNAFGAADIVVKLHDGHGGVSAASTFTITITPVNDAPSFTGDITVEEDSGPYSASFVTPGASEADQAIGATVTSNSNPALFAAGPSISADGSLSFTPAMDAFGIADLTIDAVDDGGTANGGDDSATTTARVTIEPVNDPPLIRAHLPTGAVGVRDTITSPRTATADFDLITGNWLRTQILDFLDIVHPAFESDQEVIVDFIPEDSALVIFGNWYEDDDMLFIQEGTWPNESVLVEIIAYDSVPGSPTPMDTTRLQMRVLLNEGPSIKGGGWKTVGEEGAPCIPIDLPSSAEFNWFEGWEDMDGDGDVDRYLEVRNDNSATQADVFYTDDAGIEEYIPSGATMSVPLGASLCFEPREHRHSSFDPEAGEFETFGSVDFRPVDDLEQAGPWVTVDIVVTPVF